jgi:hypothetical protein
LATRCSEVVDFTDEVVLVGEEVVSEEGLQGVVCPLVNGDDRDKVLFGG